MTSALDSLLVAADNALRTLSGASHAARPYPQAATPASVGTVTPDEPVLNEKERRLSGALMRVNHVGEVCAQALYHAQSLTARNPELRRHFEQAARDEGDHLAWTQRRLDELGARRSLLNPVWYAGSFAIGLLAGRRGDAASLGFVVETERQVERHLDGHLDRLPLADTPSRALVEQMKQDEARHAAEAEQSGAAPLPWGLRWAMRATAKVMTTVAHRV